MRMQKRPRTYPPDCLQSSDNSRETSWSAETSRYGRSPPSEARQQPGQSIFCTLLSFSLRFFYVYRFYLLQRFL